MRSPNFDFLGQIFGKAKRRQAETQARHDAQAALDANKGVLTELVFGAIGAVPQDSAPNELHSIAQALLSQALASPAVLARVPPAARPALAGAIAQALAGVPLPDALRAGAIGTFQIYAKSAVAQAVRSLTL